MGLTNPWAGLSVKQLFKRDAIIMDDFVFRLHYQVNYFFVGLGVLFIFAENYLDGRAIECRGADGYATKFCWLHGSGYIGDNLRRDLESSSGGGRQCRMNPQGLTESARNERVTSYYIWLPFLLLIIMGLAKIGRLLWKELLEDGTLERILLRRNSESRMSPLKMAEEFKKLRPRALMKFAVSYIVCELLNVVGVIVSISILNKVLLGKYADYGSDYIKYLNSSDEDESHNPMCQIFPTIVSCLVRTGGSSGGTDVSDHICILSNNLFNMYYFMLLWFWWVILITISVLQIIIRFGGICVPSLMKSSEDLGTGSTFAERFLVNFLRRNLDPDTYEEFCSEVGGTRRHYDLVKVQEAEDVL